MYLLIYYYYSYVFVCTYVCTYVRTYVCMYACILNLRLRPMFVNSIYHSSHYSGFPQLKITPLRLCSMNWGVHSADDHTNLRRGCWPSRWRGLLAPWGGPCRCPRARPRGSGSRSYAWRPRPTVCTWLYPGPRRSGSDASSRSLYSFPAYADCEWINGKERKGNVLFNDALNTFYLRKKKMKKKCVVVFFVNKMCWVDERMNAWIFKWMILILQLSSEMVINLSKLRGKSVRSWCNRWVVGSILHGGGTIELYIVPASAPRLV